MNELAPRKIALGEFLLDPAARELRRGDEPVTLARLPFGILVYLVEHRDRLVTRDELIERFWDGKDVYDATLHKAVSAVRKALGDSAAEPRFVETRYREGYRYVGPFDELAEPVEPAAIDIETTRAVGIAIDHSTGDPARTAPIFAVALRTRAVAAGVAAAAVVALLIPVAFRRPSSDRAALPPAAAAPRSIAVLPLEGVSGEPGEAYLGEGIAESLIGDLAHVNGLKVISRRSAFAFKGTEADPREIGRRLGVESILEGTVRRAGESVRVEVRLVSTEDGRILWTGDAGGRLTGSLVEVQDALACSVSSELRVAVCGEGARVPSRYTSNADAYREYLRGRYHWNRRSTEDMWRAVERFEAALAADPSYALAYAGLAETYAVMAANSNAPAAEVRPKGEAAARRAIELDDTLPSAWAALGLLESDAFEWDEAERTFERALSLNPDYGPARQWYAHTLLVRGRFEDCEAELRRAERSDPLSYPIANSLSELYYNWRKYELAIAEAKVAAELEPSQLNPYHVMALSYAAIGRADEALEAADRAGAEEHHGVEVWLTGSRDDQRRYVDRVARMSFAVAHPYSIACMYAKAGDADQAIRWLERAYDAHQPDLALVKVAPDFDSVRADPRYADIVHRVGLAD